MRNCALFVTLFVLACGGGNAPRVPTAKLSVPACVIGGNEVRLDAAGSSDPDGRIARYIFSVDGQVKLANNLPFVVLPSAKPKVIDGQLTQYAVRLTVVDDDGFEAHAQANFFVVYDGTQCPDGLPSQVDIVAQDWSSSDVVSAEVSRDAMDYDLRADAGPTDVPLPLEVTGFCPNVTGKYNVQVFCYGSLHLELELVLQQQDGCVISEENGLVEGTVDETGQIILSSTFPYLNMEECKGSFDDPENFALECSTGCTTVFLMN